MRVQDKKLDEPRAVLSWADVQRVAVEAMVAIDTVRRWARGDRVSSLTNARITRAMNRLGVRPRAETKGTGT